MDEQVVAAARRAMDSDARIEVTSGRLAFAFASGDLTVDGEVASVAAKRLALLHLAALPEVAGIVDRLRVRPASAMGDREIVDHLLRAYSEEPAFLDYELYERVGDATRLLRGAPAGPRGRIEISVAEGLVTLDGALPGLADKRLAGVLAWWVPGSRDVINGIAVEPDEADGDDKVADALRLVLDKDPFVAAGQIRVGVRDFAVTLTGAVASAAERHMAECDAWYLFGVDRVDNRIEVVA